MANYGIFDTQLGKFVRTYTAANKRPLGGFEDSKFQHIEMLGPEPKGHSWNGAEMVYDLNYVNPEKLRVAKERVVAEIKKKRDEIINYGIRVTFDHGGQSVTDDFSIDDKAQFRIQSALSDAKEYNAAKPAEAPEFVFQGWQSRNKNKYNFTQSHFQLLKNTALPVIIRVTGAAFDHEVAVEALTTPEAVNNYDWKTGWDS